MQLYVENMQVATTNNVAGLLNKKAKVDLIIENLVQQSTFEGLFSFACSVTFAIFLLYSNCFLAYIFDVDVFNWSYFVVTSRMPTMFEILIA